MSEETRVVGFVTRERGYGNGVVVMMLRGDDKRSTTNTEVGREGCWVNELIHLRGVLLPRVGLKEQ